MNELKEDLEIWVKKWYYKTYPDTVYINEKYVAKIADALLKSLKPLLEHPEEYIINTLEANVLIDTAIRLFSNRGISETSIEVITEFIETKYKKVVIK